MYKHIGRISLQVNLLYVVLTNTYKYLQILTNTYKYLRGFVMVCPGGIHTPNPVLCMKIPVVSA